LIDGLIDDAHEVGHLLLCKLLIHKQHSIKLGICIPQKIGFGTEAFVGDLGNEVTEADEKLKIEVTIMTQPSF